MLLWLIFFPLNVIVMLFCYITNPFVCLFCDEAGELPWIFSLWQTWDDSCNPRFFIVDKVAKIFRFNYDKHYEEYWDTTPGLAPYNRQRCFARVIDPNFTWKERIQRYFCRVLWLTRNCSYGFAFYWFARDAHKSTWVEKGIYKDDDHYFRYGWDVSQPLWKRTWCVKFDWYWTKHLVSGGFLGWKINSGFPDGEIQHSMIAQRVIPINYDLNR